MTFGRSPGPPASQRQLRQLTELVEAAGHTDFADARGPLGLNQRQAGGRFTREEADELIARLEYEADIAAGRVTPPAAETDDVPDAGTDDVPDGGADGGAVGARPAPSAGRPASGRRPASGSRKAAPTARASSARPAGSAAPAGGRQARNLRTVPTELLAAELQRRGWIVVEP